MKTLHQVFEDSAGRHAGRTVVRDPARDARVTYGELRAEAARIGELLARNGLQAGDRVGLVLPKCIGAVAAILGILGRRGVYVPVDCGAPPERSLGILSDCAVKAVVADRATAERLYGESAPRTLGELSLGGVDLVVLAGAADSGAVADEGEGLAYILYTSGSTGKPKGVMHTDASALSFVDWCSETFAPTAEDRFSSHAPFHFDLSILDLYVPMAHGASIVLIGEDAGKQPLQLAPLIAEERISVWYSTPSVLRLLAEHGKMDRYDFSALRIVLFAGEVFPIKHLRALREIWDGPRFYNLYGPTETNVCTYHELPVSIEPERTEPYPIGIPCSGDVAIVVDHDGAEVAAGEEGELLIRGGSVMRGYWNRPEQTARAHFTDRSGAQWYRTGDMVRQDPDGTYVFLGRRDRMVKRRGYRVELGEIENALYRHPKISEAAVVALPDEDSGLVIQSFVAWDGTSKPSLIEMKQFCSQNLPLYMIPDRFSFLPELPKTSTDKIDYQKLMELG